MHRARRVKRDVPDVPILKRPSTTSKKNCSIEVNEFNGLIQKQKPVKRVTFSSYI